MAGVPTVSFSPGGHYFLTIVGRNQFRVLSADPREKPPKSILEGQELGKVFVTSAWSLPQDGDTWSESLLLLGTATGDVMCFDLDRGKSVFQTDMGVDLFSMSTSRPRKAVLVARATGAANPSDVAQIDELFLTDGKKISSGRASMTFGLSAKEIFCTACSPDGTLLAVAHPGVARIWDVVERKHMCEIRGVPADCMQLCFSLKADLLALCMATSKVAVFHLRNREDERGMMVNDFPAFLLTDHQEILSIALVALRARKTGGKDGGHLAVGLTSGGRVVFWALPSLTDSAGASGPGKSKTKPKKTLTLGPILELVAPDDVTPETRIAKITARNPQATIAFQVPMSVKAPKGLEEEEGGKKGVPFSIPVRLARGVPVNPHFQDVTAEMTLPFPKGPRQEVETVTLRHVQPRDAGAFSVQVNESLQQEKAAAVQREKRRIAGAGLSAAAFDARAALASSRLGPHLAPSEGETGEPTDGGHSAAVQNLLVCLKAHSVRKKKTKEKGLLTEGKEKGRGAALEAGSAGSLLTVLRQALRTNDGGLWNAAVQSRGEVIGKTVDELSSEEVKTFTLGLIQSMHKSPLTFHSRFPWLREILRRNFLVFAQNPQIKSALETAVAQARLRLSCREPLERVVAKMRAVQLDGHTRALAASERQRRFAKSTESVHSRRESEEAVMALALQREAEAQEDETRKRKRFGGRLGEDEEEDSDSSEEEEEDDEDDEDDDDEDLMGFADDEDLDELMM
uniref:Small-subunit processome Utp12 domain-containing protein n=1 Tax=Chromera velia CCMP2878 TaxID=1169474 RepID=A0A0G4GSV0_9ALVE|eukprot:Cvel_23232.t1-p1 / transcript=Cvel_23232.t1 / gene=Cvel_23232 / organism=Chromera_velia_CCMP2878 / gene_product=hypothetical protein / transcript_product=hypothetical protein / location=Cvel_scaffold2371:16508-21093(-) / protein_length=740 / sequence_SO=supercontig / SO=protein_coding / is_pseudo=false